MYDIMTYGKSQDKTMKNLGGRPQARQMTYDNIKADCQTQPKIIFNMDFMNNGKESIQKIFNIDYYFDMIDKN